MLKHKLKSTILGLLLSSASFGQIAIRPGDPGTYTRRPDPAAKPVVERPTRGDIDLAGADALRDIQTTPSLNGVVFRFFSRLNASPRIEIDQRQPFTDASGNPSFGGNAAIVFNPVAIMNQTTEPGKEYIGGAYQVNATLQPGVTYYYIISVNRAGNGREYSSDSFRTAKRTVKVVFTQMRLISGSDEGGIADTMHRSFLFLVNPREGSEKSRFWSNVNIEPGQVRGLEQVMSPIVIQNAPDRLRILVEGKDFYSTLRCPDVSMEPIDGVNYSSPAFGNRSVNFGCRVLNYARVEFDLSRYTTNVATAPFTIVAPANLPARVSLAFDVSGYISVTYQ